jgi:hypothetical protein
MQAFRIVVALVCAWPAFGWAQSASSVAYIWQLTCPNEWHYSQHSTPEGCTEMRTLLALTCERPTLEDQRWDSKTGAFRPVTIPNPAFVRIADVCQLAHNARDCTCEYVAVRAKGRTLGDMLREMEAGRSPQDVFP